MRVYAMLFLSKLFMCVFTRCMFLSKLFMCIFTQCMFYAMLFFKQIIYVCFYTMHVLCNAIFKQIIYVCFYTILFINLFSRLIHFRIIRHIITIKCAS